MMRKLSMAMWASMVLAPVGTVLPGFASSAAASTTSAATQWSPSFWEVTADGTVFGPTFHGAIPHLAKPIVGMASHPVSEGYWLVAADGGVFSYGDASFYGSAAGVALSSPVVGMASTADGKGYWLVAADGGVFSFGDAGFYGSASGKRLAAPVIGLARSSDAKGYWLDGSDGGVFTFGDATFYGSRPAGPGSATGALMPTPDYGGYWLAQTAEGCQAYGDAFACVTSTGPSGGYSYPPAVGAAADTTRESQITPGST